MMFTTPGGNPACIRTKTLILTFQSKQGGVLLLYHNGGGREGWEGRGWSPLVNVSPKTKIKEEHAKIMLSLFGDTDCRKKGSMF